MDTKTGQRDRGRQVFVFLSYLAFLLPVLVFGYAAVWKAFERLGTIELNKKASLTDALVIFVVIAVVGAVLIYLVNVLWLLFARRMFTKVEASELVFFGPTSRFDRWLFHRMFPDDSSID